jgi:hypothetical protein
VTITGACNAATNCATLDVNTLTSASALTNLVRCTGQPAAFSTVASGTGPFTYRWTKDGTNIANATNASFAIASVSATNAATYCVIVTGTCNSSTQCATLIIGSAISTTPLTNQTRCACESATFTTIASGVGPFTYVWRKDGGVLPAETNNSLTIQGLTPTHAGTYTVTVSGACNSVSSSATLAVQPEVTAHPATFVNPGLITINDANAATPYPSPIEVRCVPGTVKKVTVVLSGFEHSFPEDVDIMLVCPTGKRIKLLSDTGGDTAVSGLTLAFDDDATSTLPEFDELVSGVYRPTDFQSLAEGPADAFPSPAPMGPYLTNLSAFNGINPNGTWSLFVFDDSTLDDGLITDGWSLTIEWEIPTPALIPAMLTDGRSRVDLTGELGKTYVIQASTNLQSWVSISTNTLNLPVLSILDSQAPAFQRRFYRAVRCP